MAFSCQIDPLLANMRLSAMPSAPSAVALRCSPRWTVLLLHRGLHLRSTRRCALPPSRSEVSRTDADDSRASSGVGTSTSEAEQAADADGREASSSATNTSSKPPSTTQPNLTDPVQTITWGGTLPGTRRAVIGGLAGLAVVLGGNLGGVTGWLLSQDGGKFAATLGLDILFPVAGHKRYADYTDGFEFTYPAAWLGDQTLARRTAQREEAARSLDPPALDGVGAPHRRRSVAEPSVAFGPASSTGEENVSVVVAPIYSGFRLESLGSPAEAAQRFLESSVAQPGSGRTATLLAASSRTDSAGQLYYSVEYIVRSDKFERHNCSVYTARRAADGTELLFTFNAQCPEERWAEDGDVLLASARSFALSLRPAVGGPVAGKGKKKQGLQLLLEPPIKGEAAARAEQAVAVQVPANKRQGGDGLRL